MPLLLVEVERCGRWLLPCGQGPGSGEMWSVSKSDLEIWPGNERSKPWNSSPHRLQGMWKWWKCADPKQSAAWNRWNRWKLIRFVLDVREVHRFCRKILWEIGWIWERTTACSCRCPAQFSSVELSHSVLMILMCRAMCIALYSYSAEHSFILFLSRWIPTSMAAPSKIGAGLSLLFAIRLPS